MTHQHNDRLFERELFEILERSEDARQIVADEFGSCAQCQHEAMQWASHECGSDHSRAWRLVLAGLEDNDDAWKFVADEIGDCRRCWEYVARQLTSLFNGRLALQARSLDNAADVAVQAISQELL